MELNILAFVYLFLRLAPFIIICFFSLSSLFNQDYKGIVLLIGVLLSCFLSILVSSLMGIYIDPNKPEICSALSIGQQELSAIPLSQTIFSYVFTYLLYFIFKYSSAYNNITTVIFFPILIIFDIYWNITNSCNPMLNIGLSIGVGAITGYLWASIIDSTDSPNLTYLANPTNTDSEVCSKPSQQTFKCNVYKNGQLITTQFKN